MDIAYNKTDGVVLPITNTRISASEYNQIAASLMQIITSAGLTPDVNDNGQLLAALKGIVGQTLVETYTSGTSWYNVWEIHNPSTGALIGKWCEQGGITDRNGNGDTVNLLKTMPNTNYQVYMFCKNRQRYAWLTSISTTQFKFNSADDNSQNNDGEFCWFVKGYLA